MARFEPSPHKEEAMEAIRNGMSVEEAAARFSISVKTAYRYKDEIEHPERVKPRKTVPAVKLPETPPGPGRPPSTATAVKTVTGPVETSKVALKGPAPTLFVLAGDTVPLIVPELDNAYRYYRQIQEWDPSIDDDFGVALAAAMRHVWRHFRDKMATQIGVAIMEEEGHDGLKT
jgi:hypothetical protein